LNHNDSQYLDLVLEPIRVCAKYKPKFGQGAKGDGLTLAQFQTLYQSDPFYSWFGLDNPMMYAAHKAAGGMTSVYRQIGIGCEKLFRTLWYRAEKWTVLTGIEGAKNPLISTYDFMREIVGYDLAAFFQRNSQTLKTEIDNILKALLALETTA